MAKSAPLFLCKGNEGYGNMHVKKVLICLLALLMLCASPALAEDDELRGYWKGHGWKFVQLGQYPYEKDGTVAPVLWRVLELKENQALLITEYVIDTQQVIFESDPEKIEKDDYRRISCYEESDLCQWLNTVCVETLFGNDPVRNVLIPDATRGELFILTMDEFRNTDYGFSANTWGEQPSRQASGTPYAVKQRGLYVYDGGVSYWAADIKAAEGTRLALVGYNGHLSWGGYTRQNVGLRLSVRVDMTQLAVTGGVGTRQNPFVLSYTGDATPIPASTATPAPEQTAAETVQAEVTAITATPVPTAAPTEASAPTAVPSSEGETLLSFVGDCSIGDSEQYATYDSSYHTAIDNNGYAWPFSLVKDYLAADDLTLANLEVVFTDRYAHTDKVYNMVGDPDHVNVLLEGSVEMVNTVNNHCMDFYRDGYQDTLDILTEAGVEYFGTIYPWQDDGYDDLAVKEINGIRFGFMGFSYPSESDQKRIANRVKILKEDMGCDVVIVSLHWGRETHTTPTAGQVAYAKEAINAGADVIWGHHPHVLQPIMFYKGKPIMFSTGNFTFGTMSQVDPATGIFQLAYERVNGEVQLKRLQVIPCQTQPSPDFRPFVLTDEAARKDVFRKLVYKKTYAKCDNPPESFLETGVIYFENGEMLP